MEKGVPVPRETAAHWYNYCSLEYLSPVYEVMHQELLAREILHADEVPCQVLHEEGKTATSKSYMWIYLSGTDGKPPIILYDYRPGPVSYTHLLLINLLNMQSNGGIEQIIQIFHIMLIIISKTLILMITMI